jgi:3-methylfumaryl-CoA hydratase
MALEPIDASLLKQWVGRTETRRDTSYPGTMEALAAVLDYREAPPRAAGLPPLWHWIYFWAVAPQSELGPDGHPQRGKFLPPVPLPRRMWAGGRLRFLKPLPIGVAINRSSEILAVEMKQGRTGDMAFVTLRHEIADEEGTAIIEEHDIVYRSAAEPGTPVPQPRPAPLEAAWTETVQPDPVLLFRYSALTFNGHRIHYDRSYATEVEGYPGLIVHGPLIATLLVESLRRQMPDARLLSFNFRAVGPLFDTDAFQVSGQPDPDQTTVRLWASNARGELAMQAEAVIAASSNTATQTRS